MFRFFALLCALCVYAPAAHSQVISLSNPSFEDTPSHSKTPESWFDCGPPSESPPDILPDKTFQVNKIPYHGDTYVGLVTRDNYTWESVGAPLSSPILKGNCYAFQLALSRSTSYFSVSRKYNVPANFVSPVRLNIWAGNAACERAELLAETPTIDHYNWKSYSFTVKPIQDSYTHLVFEVFYPDNIIHATNGNLLIDGISAITLFADCEEDSLQADLDKTQQEIPPTVFELPAEGFFDNKKKVIRQYLDETLSELQFFFNRGGLELTQNRFQLVGDERIYYGSPQLYALQNALSHFPNERWGLFVRETSEERRAVKVQLLSALSSNEFGGNL